MRVEDMKKEILKAIKNNEVTARTIDIKGKGANITRIKRGGSVGAEKIREIFQQLEENREKLEEKLLEENRGKLEELEKTRGKLHNALEEIARLKKVQTHYEVKIIELKEKIRKLEESKEKPLEEIGGKEKILGFALVQKKDHGKLYWYAYKMQKNKMYWVYIGKDRTRAKDKIKNWLSKRGLDADIFV